MILPIALKLERHNNASPSAGANTSRASSTNTTPIQVGTIRHQCRMTTPRRKLSPFEKKLKPGDETWTCFHKDSEWSSWKMIMHFAKLGLSDMGDIVKLGYSVLQIVNGDFSRSHYSLSLHKKKNLKLLFALLKAHIKTNESIIFVKMRHADMEES